MDYKNKVKDLIDIFESSNLSEMEFDADGLRLRLKKSSTSDAEMLIENQMRRTESKQDISILGTWDLSNNEDESSKEYIKSPLVGTLYLAANPQSPPFVDTGSKVKEGETLCIIEAMKMMNELKAPFDLIVKSVLRNNGEMVEFDENIYEVERC